MCVCFLSVWCTIYGYVCALDVLYSVVAQITSQPQLIVADTNGNHDSGYAPSNVDDVLTGIAEESPPDSPVVSGTLQRPTISSRQDTGADESSKREPALRCAMKNEKCFSLN